MLAGDAGDAVVAPASGTAHVAPLIGSIQAAGQQQVDKLVFVDPGVENLQQLTSGITEGAELILLDPQQNGLDQITSVLNARTNVQSVHIIAHGSEGHVQLGIQTVNEAALVDAQSQVRSWRGSLAADADILLYSCETAKGQVGQRFIARLAALSGADVAASTDVTGGVGTEGDWDLEANVGDINSAMVLSQEVRSRYNNTLDISIRAAGTTGQEEMRLLVDGNVAGIWTVGGDAYASQFETYTVDLDGVSASDVRVEFTNDLFDEASGIDRNLRVDSVTIDGTVFETEDPSVFSTGTWRPEDGIVPGFGRGEFLNSTGYFQFADSNGGTQIRIAARGDEGGESMSLVINGETVQSWSVTTQQTVYTFNTSSSVAIEDIQVHFTNDQYDPANGIDSNLIVDFVELDGTRYETEAPTTFSTGSWLPEDGIQPGFRQSETLNTNGFFQYATAAPANQIQIAARGDEGGESMSLVINGQTVQTWTVTTNNAVYSYDVGSSISISDVQIHFTNDQFDPDNGVDSNLIVDYVELSGTRYETEAPTTFSTGSWLPEDGIQPGFRQSETLNTNGYFQYVAQQNGFLTVNDASGQQGSTIALDISLDVPSGSQGAVIISNVPFDTVIESNGNTLDRSGDSVLVSVADLNGLTITPDSDFAGSILLNVEGILLDGSFNETTETVTLTVAVSSVNGTFSRNGSEGRDYVLTYEGNAAVDSLGGNDVVIGLDDDNQLLGGNGNDVLLGGVGADILVGDDGNDLIEGGLGTDTIEGSGGNDRLFGQGGDDVINGGAGDDEIHGGSGNDVINGGTGTDVVVVEGARAQYVVQAVNGNGFALIGPGGTDTIFEVEVVQFADGTVPIASITDANFVPVPAPSIDGASELDDTLSGDFVIGRGGNDVITGTGGDDILLGGDGDDQVDGGDGNDYLDGGAGTDSLNGGSGNDFFVTSTGQDTIDGGFGWDTVNFSLASGGVTIDLSTGVTTGANGSTLVSIEAAHGSRFSDTFTFDALSDGSYFTVDGSEGSDVLELTQFRLDQFSLQGSYAQISLDGGGVAELDIYNVEFVELFDAIVQTSDGQVIAFFPLNDFLFGNEFGNTLYGGEGNDRILGFGGNDTLGGGDDDDVLFGGFGNDTIHGDNGNDELYGEAGDDNLNGGSGDDRLVDAVGNNTLFGGSGFDTAVYSEDRTQYTAELLTDGSIRVSGADGTDTVHDVESFEFAGDSFSVAELLNNNPVAVPDTFTGPANIPIGGSVAPNDFDPDGDTLIYALARPPQNGTLQFSPTGAFLYTPNPGFVGTDIFLYAATDVNGGIAVVPVTIVIS